MRIFVINLEASRERRVFMERQFAALGMAAEFFPAIDGRLLSEAEVERVSDRKWFRRHVGRDMTRTDLGCSLSHLAVYKKIVEDNIPFALVLEDDAWLTPSIVPVLSAIEQDLDNLPVDIVLLSECIAVQRTIWRKGYYFMSPVLSALFSHAYVITLRSAQLLTEVLSPVAHPADAWNWLLSHHIIRLAAVHPVLATQSQPVVGIADLHAVRRLPARGSPAWFRHKMWRAFWKLFDAWVPMEWHRQLVTFKRDE